MILNSNYKVGDYFKYAGKTWCIISIFGNSALCKTLDGLDIKNFEIETPLGF